MIPALLTFTPSPLTTSPPLSLIPSPPVCRTTRKQRSGAPGSGVPQATRGLLTPLPLRKRRSGAPGSSVPHPHELRQQKSAVILVSGGLDSTTVLAMARDQGYACHTLSFDYGQRHRAELRAAERVAESLSAWSSTRWVQLTSDAYRRLRPDRRHRRAQGSPPDEVGGDMPVTYVPARNTIFLSFASPGRGDRRPTIFIGVNAVDYSGYPTAARSTSTPLRPWPTWRPARA